MFASNATPPQVSPTAGYGAIGGTPAQIGGTAAQELEYANNSTYKRYSGYDVLNIQPSDVFTAAEYPRPLGYMERLAGVRNGVDELRSRIESFAGRIACANVAGNNGQAPQRADMEGMLDETETSLRRAFEVLEALHKVF